MNLLPVLYDGFESLGKFFGCSGVGAVRKHCLQRDGQVLRVLLRAGRLGAPLLYLLKQRCIAGLPVVAQLPQRRRFRFGSRYQQVGEFARALRPGNVSGLFGDRIESHRKVVQCLVSCAGVAGCQAGAPLVKFLVDPAPFLVNGLLPICEVVNRRLRVCRQRGGVGSGRRIRGRRRYWHRVGRLGTAGQRKRREQQE